MNGFAILRMSTGKRAEVAQRGVAGAEVVDRDLDAEAAELGEQGERRLGVVQQVRLRELEDERAWPEAVLLERTLDVVDEASARADRARR